MQRQRGDEPLSIIYPLVVLFALTAVLGGAVAFILPKFGKIFEDFEQELPALTVAVMRNGELISPPLLAIGGAGMLAIIIISFVMLLSPEGGSSALLIRRGMMWWLPITHSIERDRGLADLFDTLADALEAGLPLPAAIDATLKLNLNPVLRGRVALWHQRVSAGIPLADAAREAKLSPLVVGMLRTGAAGGDLPQVCRFIARYHAMRFSRTAEVIRATFLPLTVLILAVAVGLFVIAMFLPLVHLIQATAASAL
jgi:type II secretory pathway component PulF